MITPCNRFPKGSINCLDKLAASRETNTVQKVYIVNHRYLVINRLMKPGAKHSLDRAKNHHITQVQDLSS